MADDKNVGERLASIEALLSSQKEGQNRIERSLEKTNDELSARHSDQDKALNEMRSILSKVDQRSANDHQRVDALELLVHTKIDKIDAVTKSEMEPLRDMLKRIDGHLNWAVKIVLGLVIAAVVGGVVITKPWSQPTRPVASVSQPHTPSPQSGETVVN